MVSIFLQIDSIFAKISIDIFLPCSYNMKLYHYNGICCTLGF